MNNKNYGKDLFQLQTELIDAKVDMAVSKAIDRVIDQIIDLKGQMNAQFSEVNKQLSHLDTRLSKLEHRVDAHDKALHSINTLLTEIRSKVIAYSFRGGWAILAGIMLILAAQVNQLFHFFA